MVQSLYVINLKFLAPYHFGLCLTWTGTKKTGFLATGLIFYLRLITHDTRDAGWLVPDLLSGKAELSSKLFTTLMTICSVLEDAIIY